MVSHTHTRTRPDPRPDPLLCLSLSLLSSLSLSLVGCGCEHGGLGSSGCEKSHRRVTTVTNHMMEVDACVKSRDQPSRLNKMQNSNGSISHVTNLIYLVSCLFLVGI